MEEYFLITWQESGDETHFMMLSMSDYDYVKNALDKFADNRTLMIEINRYTAEIYNKAVKSYFIQTYCNDDWPFGQYNIKKIISIPEFGC